MAVAARVGLWIKNYMKYRKIRKITICCSANFYKDALAVQSKLEKSGFRVTVPHTATIMKKTGDYNPTHYKVWYSDKGKYKIKAGKMRRHFNEIVKSDAILVLYLKKHNQNGYIGGNTLMEMGLAFHLKKPIFVWREASPKSAIYEEILGVLPVFINADIGNIK